MAAATIVQKEDVFFTKVEYDFFSTIEATDKKKFFFALIWQKIESIKRNFFRNIFFAEFRELSSFISNNSLGKNCDYQHES